MAQGRCAGCGALGSLAKVERHVPQCPRYIELYESDPDRALSPAAEFERWQRDERNPEAKAASNAEAKEARLGVIFSDQDVRRERQEQRWATPKDILAD